MRKKIIIIALALMGLVHFSKAENVNIEDFTITCGETMTVTLDLTNSRTDLTAFELTLTLPEGLTLDTENCQLTERYPGLLRVGSPDENVYTLCGLSVDLGTITGTDGALISLPVTASDTFRGGVATITGGYFVSTERDRIEIDDVEVQVGYELKPGTLLGDVNNDGVVTITDVISTVNYVTGNVPAVFVEANADLDGNGIITITDVMHIVNIVTGN